jgi:hypothetical protein
VSSVSSPTAEAALTALANFAGYLALFAVIIYALRALNRRKVGRVPAAALALVVAFGCVMAWYVGTVFWLDTYPVHDQPPWLEATSGVAENVESEIIQVWLAALLFAHLLWPGSPESKE